MKNTRNRRYAQAYADETDQSIAEKELRRDLHGVQKAHKETQHALEECRAQNVTLRGQLTAEQHRLEALGESLRRAEYAEYKTRTSTKEKIEAHERTARRYLALAILSWIAIVLMLCTR